MNELDNIFKVGPKGRAKARKKEAKAVARYLKRGNGNPIQIVKTLQSERDGITMVEVKWLYGNKETWIYGVGGSKRNKIDDWNPDLGLSIAYNRAVLDLSYNLLALKRKEKRETLKEGGSFREMLTEALERKFGDRVKVEVVEYGDFEKIFGGPSH